MSDGRRRRIAAAGGVCGAGYLAANQLLPSIPEFFLGILLGTGIVLMLAGMLPEGALEKLRKWKGRGA